MARKTIIFKSKMNNDNIDRWVEGNINNNALEKEDSIEKRFTVVVSNVLYKSMKIRCAEKEISIKEFINALLEKELLND